MKTCVCGNQFRQRKRGRCPHCGLRIYGYHADGLSIFEQFAELEREGGRVGVLAFQSEHVSLYFFDPSARGAARYGWRGWPNALNESEISELHRLASETNLANRLSGKEMSQEVGA